MFFREQLSSQLEQLRMRLAESQQSLQSCTAELQQLQTEHDTLLERHNKILQENVTKEAELRERSFICFFSEFCFVDIHFFSLPLCVSVAFNFLLLCNFKKEMNGQHADHV